MNNFEETKRRIVGKLDSADNGKHPIGALILAVSDLLEIIEKQNAEIESLKTQVQGIQHRETLQPAFYGNGGY